MEDVNRNMLEAARLQRIAADAEKKRAEEQCLKACDQMDCLRKEAGEAKKHLNELEVYGRA